MNSGIEAGEERMNNNEEMDMFHSVSVDGCRTGIHRGEGFTGD